MKGLLYTLYIFCTILYIVLEAIPFFLEKILDYLLNKLEED